VSLCLHASMRRRSTLLVGAVWRVHAVDEVRRGPVPVGNVRWFLMTRLFQKWHDGEHADEADEEEERDEPGDVRLLDVVGAVVGAAVLGRVPAHR
jgi:hypothetical protein